MRHDKFMGLLCDEIDKIADKGLSATNIENAFKLVDMYKDMLVITEMEENGESSRYSRDDGSYRSGKHYVRGHYSRDDGMNDRYSRYMESKASYRNSGSMESRADLMESIKDYMDDMTTRLEDMYRDSDSQEERQTIQRYINKMRNM